MSKLGSAVKMTYQRPLRKWISGAQMSVEYSRPDGGRKSSFWSALDQSVKLLLRKRVMLVLRV